MDHPFSEFHVYSPAPVHEEVRLPSCAKNIVLPSVLPPALWEQFTLLRAHGNKNLLFCPSYVLPFLARCPTFLIHHGSYEAYPQEFSRWALSKARVAYSLSAKRANVVCTVSESSKRDMVHFYGLKPDQIHVIPEGVDTQLFRPIPQEERLAEWRTKFFGTDTPYIAYAGKPVERRNLSSLIKAFGLLRKEKGIPHKLLIVGADLPGTSPLRQVIASEGLNRDVVVVGYMDHQEMVLAYNAADLFVYPSSYEGFGMPVLEAMACGTPVIALNNTAFPEFAGGVAHLLDNADVTTLKQGIDTVLNDPMLRQRMSMTGPRRAAGYDWHIIARRYLDLMLPLVSSRTGG
jgi:glycosyltransferase involved in cell wall biosynthesis